MFSKIATALLLLAVTINAAAAEIDFTPALTEYTAQGFTYRKVTFKNDEGSVTFTPPRGWTIRGAKDQLQLNPPNTNFVEAVIRAAPLPGSPRFDEPTVKALEQQVMSEVPPGVQSMQLVRRQENPVVMGPNLSYGFVVSYTTLGRTFQRSVIFVNCVDHQLILRFSAPKADFDTFNGDFCRSISSWHSINEPAAPAAGALAPSVMAVEMHLFASARQLLDWAQENGARLSSFRNSRRRSNRF
jgi:hypothetical protein